MSLASPIPNYEIFAQMQNEVKGQDVVELITLALEQLMLQHLPKRARLLDLGCGTAHLVQEFHNLLGFRKCGLHRN
ncbi:hypothetical protein PQG02_34535 (plasmid) [Nostoc sp. UHCC 0926]|uniref:hypothetical protein n=1 Tax=Nostoc sp. UHCC 0926 TaxID=3025190 RepID=UPI00235FE774|nr:hypothetical protein [Nostoc sp. UHCC 0926]WDD36952.1 hypothetical protein PQG02_34535 [Nostoc sp. UHCC 0926]